MNDELVTIYKNDDEKILAIVINEYPDYVVYTTYFRIKSFLSLVHTKSTIVICDAYNDNIIENLCYVLIIDPCDDTVRLRKRTIRPRKVLGVIELPKEVGYEVINKLKEMIDNNELDMS